MSFCAKIIFERINIWYGKNMLRISRTYIGIIVVLCLLFVGGTIVFLGSTFFFVQEDSPTERTVLSNNNNKYSHHEEIRVEDVLRSVDRAFAYSYDLEAPTVDYSDSDTLLFLLNSVFDALPEQQKRRYETYLLPPTDENSFFSYAAWQQGAQGGVSLIPEVYADEPSPCDAHADLTCFEAEGHIVFISITYPNIEVYAPLDVADIAFSNAYFTTLATQALAVAENAYTEYESFFPASFPVGQTIRYYIINDIAGESLLPREYYPYWSDYECSADTSPHVYPPPPSYAMHLSCDAIYIKHNANPFDGTVAHETFHCFQQQFGYMDFPLVNNELHYIESTAMYGEELAIGNDANVTPTYERFSLDARDGIVHYAKRYPDGLFWIHRANQVGAPQVKQEILTLTPSSFYPEQIGSLIGETLHQLALDASGNEYIYTAGLGTRPTVAGTPVPLKTNCSRACFREKDLYIDTNLQALGSECSQVTAACTEMLNGDYIKVVADGNPAFLQAHLEVSTVMDTLEGIQYKKLDFRQENGQYVSQICLSENDYCAALGESDIYLKPSSFEFIFTNDSTEEEIQEEFHFTVENIDEEDASEIPEEICELAGDWRLTSERVATSVAKFTGRTLTFDCQLNFTEDFSTTEPIIETHFIITNTCEQEGGSSGTIEFINETTIQTTLESTNARSVCQAGGTPVYATGPGFGIGLGRYSLLVSGSSLTITSIIGPSHIMEYVKAE
jgi:hypothetical protein